MFKPEQIDTAFPGHREAAIRDGVHPDFQASYIPLGSDRAPFTKAQKDLLFPTRGTVLAEIVKTTPDVGPCCPHCLNLEIDCICDQLKERAL
jgi:hypothetical protein